MSNERDQRVKNAISAVATAIGHEKLTSASGENLGRWLSEPYYVEYRERILDLIERSDYATLNSLFWERIPFGTGGRRGPMSEFGSATINARTIAESAHGLAVYVQRTTAPQNLTNHDSRILKAVIARDTRHRSAEFARLAASILAAHGFKVFFFLGTSRNAGTLIRRSPS